MNKIIYLDAAATALKPDAVIEAEVDFLQNKYANAGRGICARASAVDDMLANTRMRVASFIGAQANQIVFTSGATDGLNTVARMLRRRFQGQMRVAVSDLDHHSARMPFVRGADVQVVALDKNYNYDLDKIPAVDVMVITAMSNVFGWPQNVLAIVAAARQKNPDVITVVDAAQYAAHMKIDVRAWDCDFLCFSGHKIGADTGIGVMYIKNPDDFYPDKFGGGMVARIDGDAWHLEPAPARFEAGTLPLTQIAGLTPAIDAWRPHAGRDVMRRLYDGLSKNSAIHIYTAPDASVFTFAPTGMHVLDFGAMAGARGLCMRVGNMCATWAMRLIDAPAYGVARLSAGAWNTLADADAAVDIINGIMKNNG